MAATGSLKRVSTADGDDHFPDGRALLPSQLEPASATVRAM
jgi:hypothetical protein